MTGDPGLTVLAVGDLSFNGRYHRLPKSWELGSALEELRARWEGGDLILGNLESPITRAPRAAPAKATLRGSPVAARILKNLGFRAVSLANNHAMDFGPEGLFDTIEALTKEGIPFVGAGVDAAAARRPLILEARGRKVGILAYCDVEQASPLYAGPNTAGVAALDPTDCVRDISTLRPQVDWLIVQLHWGRELWRLPNPEQREIARRFSDAGADLILGHHPHVLQPLEMFGETPVFYSLGNFFFSEMYWRGRNSAGEAFSELYRIHDDSRRTGWAEVTFRNGSPAAARFLPAWLDRDSGVRPDDDPIRVKEWEQLSMRLSAPNYPDELDRERRAADARSTWAVEWSLRRWILQNLFHFGLSPWAVEAK